MLFHANAKWMTARQILTAHAVGRGGAVSAWLWSVAGLVFLMVFLGGATRLTESGLSITEWKPVTGVIPPLGHAAWLAAFAKYKAIPQYTSLFPDMTLGHFQAIFLMEWFHRLVGRLLAPALLIPLIVFAIQRRVTARLGLQMLGIFALGGLQGFVGWWMVSSGLTGRIEVAQERLAVHLLLASITFAALVWIAASQKTAGAERGAGGSRRQRRRGEREQGDGGDLLHAGCLCRRVRGSFLTARTGVQAAPGLRSTGKRARARGEALPEPRTFNAHFIRGWITTWITQTFPSTSPSSSRSSPRCLRS